MVVLCVVQVFFFLFLFYGVVEVVILFFGVFVELFGQLVVVLCLVKVDWYGCIYSFQFVEESGGLRNYFGGDVVVFEIFSMYYVN